MKLHSAPHRAFSGSQAQKMSPSQVFFVLYFAEHRCSQVFPLSWQVGSFVQVVAVRIAQEATHLALVGL